MAKFCGYLSDDCYNRLKEIKKLTGMSQQRIVEKALYHYFPIIEEQEKRLAVSTDTVDC